MKQERTGFRESHLRKNEDELTLALLRLLVFQKKWKSAELVERVLRGPTLFTLSIEAEGLEDNIKTRHTAQFVSSTHQPEL
jgi:hypothetical protein